MAFFEDNAGPGIADASGPAALFGCAVRRGYPQAGSLSPEAIACGPLAQAAVQNITQFDEGSTLWRLPLLQKPSASIIYPDISDDRHRRKVVVAARFLRR
ncbi:hypothetical protein LDZ95_32125, partial [Pseudomonas aeruginosa]|nr:hypothetical protein [Pseudomonas aeruginosa]